MCDPSTTTCENTIGSYLCMCKPGHFRIASHICLSENIYKYSDYNNDNGKGNDIEHYGNDNDMVVIMMLIMLE